MSNALPRRHLINIACSSLILSAAPAWAQQATAPAKTEAEESLKLETVVVSAQKRTEALKDVPQAVSAYDGAELSSQGITSATDLRIVAPSLNFSASANVRGEGFQMRGVGTSVFGDTVEQSVGFMVDGVPMARSGQGSGGMLDVERVEVLRGPQGMLFGKNASAGLVSVVSKRPRFGHNSVEALVSYSGKFDETKTQLIGNIAMGENGALRIAYASTQADGYVKNVKSGQMLNDRDEQLLKAKFLYNFSDTAQLYVIADQSRSRAACCAFTARVAPAGTTFAALNAANGITPTPTNTQIAANGQFYQNGDSDGVSAEFNLDLNWATLTSVTAIRNWKTADNNDPDLLPINILDINSGRSDLRQRSQELRLTSPGGGNLEWVGGLYAYDQRNQSNAEQTGNFGGLFTPFGVPAGANLGVVQDTLTKNAGSALFGQASVRMAPMKFTAGARYTREKVDLDYASTPSTAIRRPGYTYGTTKGSASDNNFSWRLTAQADLNKDNMVYLTTARGYKGPGLEFLDNGSAPVSVINPEIPTTVEAGMRSLLWGGTTALNAAMFKTRFNDFQAQVFDQTVTPSKFRTVNAGRLDTQGIELEINSRVTRALTLNGSVAWVDAVYGDFKSIPCYAGQPALPFTTVRTSPRQCILSSAATNAQALTEGTDNALPNAPKLTYNLGAHYDLRFDSYKSFAQLNYNWRDKVSYSAAGDPALVQGAYGVVNASLGFGAADGRWMVTIFGRNLGNKHFVERVISQPTLGGAGVTSQFTTPNAYRSYGLTFSMRFGD